MKYAPQYGQIIQELFCTCKTLRWLKKHCPTASKFSFLRFLEYTETFEPISRLNDDEVRNLVERNSELSKILATYGRRFLPFKNVFTRWAQDILYDENWIIWAKQVRPTTTPASAWPMKFYFPTICRISFGSNASEFKCTR